MRIYPEKGHAPTPNDFQAFAAASLKFGLVVYIGREKTKSGYRKFVELMRPVEFGIKKAAPSGANTGSGQEGGI